MSTLDLVQSSETRRDLSNIYHYSLDNWGANKAREYMDRLRARMSALRSNPLLGATHPDLPDGVHCLVAESHQIFYRVRSDTIEILRVLHLRQDARRRFGR